MSNRFEKRVEHYLKDIVSRTGNPPLNEKAIDALISYVQHEVKENWRDPFAAKAMQGLLANSYADCNRPTSTATATEIADMAYEQADAMLEARGKPQS